MRGGQWQCLYLARGLRQRSESVRVLARGELRRTLAAEGFENADCGLANFWRWSRWADVAHAQDARSHALAALVCRCPLVVARRVAFPIRQSAVSRWKYRGAARYLAVSRYVASRLAEAGIPADRIAVVPDGVPDPELAAKPFPARRFPFLALSTGDANKGDDLVREASKLTGFDVAWTTRLAEDVADARVFVYISRSEGFGSAALLAMANGAAVIASREGGLQEAVEHEVTGLLVENRPGEIASAMVRLASHPSLAENLGRCGRTRARTLFSIERMVDATTDAYRSVPR